MKEGCFIIAVSLNRISEASGGAAWAERMNRRNEAAGFLLCVKQDITLGKKAGYITEAEAGEMESCIERYSEATKKNDDEKIQETLAELSARSFEIVLNKAVECERSND